MDGVDESRREKKKKSKRARKALLAFLRRLNKACKTFQTADQWYGLVEQLEPIIQDHAEAIPANDQGRLRQAMQLAGAGREGLARGCDVLQFELSHVAGSLPGAVGAGTAVLGVVVAAAVVVTAAVVTMNARAARLVIQNRACGPLPLAGGMVPGLDWAFGALGVQLPDQPIPDGGSGTITLPPVAFDLDCTDGEACFLKVLGQSAPISLGHRVAAVTLDGEPLLGQATRVEVRPRSTHVLLVECR